jgi:hypothetical protein
MNSLEFVSKIVGEQKALWLSIFILGATLTFGAFTYYPKLVVSPDALQEQVQAMKDEQTKANAFFQIQLYEQNITTLTNELYQLKKLKIKKMADSDDLDRLIEVKQTIDSLKAKKDSLQLILINKQK